MTTWVYKQTDRNPALYTVGFYDPAGKWESESDHASQGAAARRVRWLNGGDLEQTCRVCGCTEANACPGGCWWVADDLCSRCDRKLSKLRRSKLTARAVPRRKR
jgi:hypothetical protein